MARNFELPQVYGDNKIVLMVRDPWTLYTYWETSKQVEGRVKGEIRNKGLEISKSILRVYDVTDSDPGQRIVFDFELRDWISSWYIHAGQTGREWIVDIGILCTNGEFFCFARSNMVRTPANRMSEVTDGEWMCPEELYKKLFVLSGGAEVGKSSMNFVEAIEKYLLKWLSSGGISSGMFGSSELFSKKK